MHAFVYKSRRKQDTYVYVAARDDFSSLPDPVRTQLEPFEFVLEVALAPGRRLAREDVDKVRNNLRERGFHLQFPPPPGVSARNRDAHDQG